MMRLSFESAMLDEVRSHSTVSLNNSLLFTCVSCNWPVLHCCCCCRRTAILTSSVHIAAGVMSSSHNLHCYLPDWGLLGLHCKFGFHRRDDSFPSIGSAIHLLHGHDEDSYRMDLSDCSGCCYYLHGLLLKSHLGSLEGVDLHLQYSFSQ